MDNIKIIIKKFIDRNFVYSEHSQTPKGQMLKMFIEETEIKISSKAFFKSLYEIDFDGKRLIESKSGRFRTIKGVVLK